MAERSPVLNPWAIATCKSPTVIHPNTTNHPNTKRTTPFQAPPLLAIAYCHNGLVLSLDASKLYIIVATAETPEASE